MTYNLNRGRSFGQARLRLQNNDYELPDPVTGRERYDDVLPHGDFAVQLLRAMAGEGFQTSNPMRALEECKRLQLIPPDWTAEGLLTHGEFADVLSTLGVVNAPTDRDATASPESVEAMLRHKAWLMRDYLYILYHKPGPIVSPSDFAR